MKRYGGALALIVLFTAVLCSDLYAADQDTPAETGCQINLEQLEVLPTWEVYTFKPGKIKNSFSSGRISKSRLAREFLMKNMPGVYGLVYDLEERVKDVTNYSGSIDLTSEAWAEQKQKIIFDYTIKSQVGLNYLSAESKIERKIGDSKIYVMGGVGYGRWNDSYLRESRDGKTSWITMLVYEVSYPSIKIFNLEF